MTVNKGKLLHKISAARPMESIQVDSSLPPWRRLGAVAQLWAQASRSTVDSSTKERAVVAN